MKVSNTGHLGNVQMAAVMATRGCAHEADQAVSQSMRRQLRIFLAPASTSNLTCPEQYRLYYLEKLRPRADFEEFEIALMDQLTAYMLAEPDVEEIAVCVLVKTKTPKISWHKTDRTPDQVVEYLRKAEAVARQIQAPGQVVPTMRVFAGVRWEGKESQRNAGESCLISFQEPDLCGSFFFALSPRGV
jgi:hypothetical protein